MTDLSPLDIITIVKTDSLFKEIRMKNNLENTLSSPESQESQHLAETAEELMSQEIKQDLEGSKEDITAPAHFEAGKILNLLILSASTWSTDAKEALEKMWGDAGKREHIAKLFADPKSTRFIHNNTLHTASTLLNDKDVDAEALSQLPTEQQIKCQLFLLLYGQQALDTFQQERTTEQWNQNISLYKRYLNEWSSQEREHNYSVFSPLDEKISTLTIALDTLPSTIDGELSDEKVNQLEVGMKEIIKLYTTLPNKKRIELFPLIKEKHDVYRNYLLKNKTTPMIQAIYWLDQFKHADTTHMYHTALQTLDISDTNTPHSISINRLFIHQTPLSWSHDEVREQYNKTTKILLDNSSLQQTISMDEKQSLPWLNHDQRKRYEKHSSEEIDSSLPNSIKEYLKDLSIEWSELISKEIWWGFDNATEEKQIRWVYNLERPIDNLLSPLNIKMWVYLLDAYTNTQGEERASVRNRIVEFATMLNTDEMQEYEIALGIIAPVLKTELTSSLDVDQITKNARQESLAITFPSIPNTQEILALDFWSFKASLINKVGEENYQKVCMSLWFTDMVGAAAAMWWKSIEDGSYASQFSLLQLSNIINSVSAWEIENSSLEALTQISLASASQASDKLMGNLPDLETEIPQDLLPLLELTQDLISKMNILDEEFVLKGWLWGKIVKKLWQLAIDWVLFIPRYIKNLAKRSLKGAILLWAWMATLWASAIYLGIYGIDEFLKLAKKVVPSFIYQRTKINEESELEIWDFIGMKYPVTYIWKIDTIKQTITSEHIYNEWKSEDNDNAFETSWKELWNEMFDTEANITYDWEISAYYPSLNSWEDNLVNISEDPNEPWYYIADVELPPVWYVISFPPDWIKTRTTDENKLIQIKKLLWMQTWYEEQNYVMDKIESKWAEKIVSNIVKNQQKIDELRIQAMESGQRNWWIEQTKQMIQAKLADQEIALPSDRLKLNLIYNDSDTQTPSYFLLRHPIDNNNNWIPDEVEEEKLEKLKG